MNGAPTTNKVPIIVITTTIAILAFLCVLDICVLAYQGKEVPKDLAMITTGLVGALTAILSKTSPTESLKPNPPISEENPVPVKPITSIADPVHTEEGTSQIKQTKGTV